MTTASLATAKIGREKYPGVETQLIVAAGIAPTKVIWEFNNQTKKNK